MTIDYQTTTYILAIGGSVFGIFLYFRNPQEKLDKDASVLAQKVQWEREFTEKRFTDMGVRLDTALTLAQNHTHTVDVKVDALTSTVNGMNLQLTTEITKLGTIINERIPSK